jgi:Uma2 family endonuclease
MTAATPTLVSGDELLSEVAVIVRRPPMTFSQLSAKAFRLLESGAKAVVALDPESKAVGVYRLDLLPHRFLHGDTVTLPDVLPGFAVPVAKLFE